jgi:hypothetical protein
MKTFNAIVIGLLIIWAYFSCAGAKYKTPEPTDGGTDTTVYVEAADGLDLEALTALVKEVESAEDLERKLNEPGGANNINNMDLNEDGHVDFIKVTEYGEKSAGEYGFSLTTEPAEGEVQEIATIEISKKGEDAEVQVAGDPTIYGHNHVYHSHYPIGSLLLWSYLIRPHPFYYSPFGWGYHPGYYGYYSPVGRSAYINRTRTITRNAGVTRASTARSTGIKSPNSGKVANKGIVKSLKNPTTSQKAFSARNPSKAVASGGFGRNSRSGNSRSGSTSRGFGGRGK